jgi:hypothetical protein
MSPAIVLTAAAAAVLVRVLANSKWRNREGMSCAPFRPPPSELKYWPPI